MNIAIGSDHAGFSIKNTLISHLNSEGINAEDVGCFSEESVDYPDFAKAVCEKVLEGDADFGILICGTGIGMCMAANKMKGIRAAVLNEEFSAKATREHNDANVLCLGARVIDAEKAIKLTDIFLSTPFSGEEKHIRRISKLED